MSAVWNILGVLVILLVCFFCIFYFAKETGGDGGGSTNKAKKAKAGGGVNSTVKSLGRYAATHNFTIINPANISYNGNRADLDAVVITYSGVIGIRCYGYNGEIYENPGKAEWLWVTQEGRKYIPNPVAQCDADARVLRDVLIQSNKLKNVPVECIAVFTDKKAELAVGKKSRICKQKDLMPLLESEKYLQDKGYDTEKITALLKEAVAAKE